MNEDGRGLELATEADRAAFAAGGIEADSREAREALAPAARGSAGSARQRAAVPRRWAVTVVSPRGYVHSAAFAEVAETLVHGLTALGYDAVPSTDFGLGGRQHLVLGANLLPRTGQLPREGSILYNLEQVAAGSPWLTPQLLELYRRYPLWEYSPANAAALAAMGVPRPTLVPIGYAPSLSRIAPAREDIDVLFYGSMNRRRAAVLEALARRGARVHAAFGVFGPARDALVARARIVLNLHYYEAKVFEIVRVSYLLANRRVVVSERGCDPAEEAPFEEGVAFAGYEGLVDRCLALLERPEERRSLAEAGWRIMSRRPIEAYLRDALGTPEARVRR